MNNLVESRVKEVQANGTFDSQYGMLYKFEYTMEDGTVLNANHKASSPFRIGDAVEYVITKDNQYGKSGKVSKAGMNHAPANTNYTPQGNTGAPQAQAQAPAPKPRANSHDRSASFALSYAKDIMVAAGGQHTDTNSLADETLRLAERFKTWLDNNS